MFHEPPVLGQVFRPRSLLSENAVHLSGAKVKEILRGHVAALKKHPAPINPEPLALGPFGRTAEVALLHVYELLLDTIEDDAVFTFRLSEIWDLMVLGTFPR